MDYLYMAGSLMRELSTNRLRRFLSVLGVIIGTGAVIASLAVVEGGRYQLYSYLNKLGANVVFIQDQYVPPNSLGMPARMLEDVLPKEGDAAGEKTPPPLETASLIPVFADTLSEDDIAFLKNRFTDAVHLVPQMLNRCDIGAVGGKPLRGLVEGSTPEGAAVRELKVAKGRYLCGEDMRQAEKVCVLGAEMAEKLFPAGSALGQDVVIFGSQWRVVGLLAPKGSLMRFDYDRLVIVPLSSMQKRAGAGLINAILIQARNAEAALRIRAELLPEVLRCLHKREAGDFTVFCQDELVKQKEQTQKTFRVLTVSIAAFSMLVSGIGIMNIMLVSVRERRRDIGVWKAVGATDADVLMYFLFESVLTCLVGGGMGILLGVFLGTEATGLIATTVAGTEGWVPVFKLQFFVLATGAAALTGLVSGIFPAYIAGRLEPVEALRYE